MTIRGNKGIMGIGTLIIFIATILVAAVAAAVLISTSNVLQQRSLLVGQEARKSITNAVEVISITAASDSTTETFNDFEILVRLSPGSDPIQMRKFDIQWISPFFDQAANLLFSDNETVVQVGLIENGTNTTVYDLDEDGIVDYVTLILNASGADEGLEFYLSGLEVWSDTISLYEDLNNATAANVTLDMDYAAITYNETVYSYVSVFGDTDTDNEVIASVNVTVRQIPDECEFALLPPETKYCFVIMNGNSDYVLNSGERFKLYYRLTTDNEVTIGQDFQFIFSSEKGRISEARARTPDVIISTKTALWPLG